MLQHLPVEAVGTIGIRAASRDGPGARNSSADSSRVTRKTILALRIAQISRVAWVCGLGCAHGGTADRSDGGIRVSSVSAVGVGLALSSRNAIMELNGDRKGAEGLNVSRENSSLSIVHGTAVAEIRSSDVSLPRKRLSAGLSLPWDVTAGSRIVRTIIHRDDDGARNGSTSRVGARDIDGELGITKVNRRTYVATAEVISSVYPVTRGEGKVSFHGARSDYELSSRSTVDYAVASIRIWDGWKRVARTTSKIDKIQGEE